MGGVTTTAVAGSRSAPEDICVGRGLGGAIELIGAPNLNRRAYRDEHELATPRGTRASPPKSTLPERQTRRPNFVPSAPYVGESPWPDRVASDWLNSWPGRFWSGDLHPEVLPHLSPEDLAQCLVDDLRDERIDRFVELSTC